jgi:hypothetical protein
MIVVVASDANARGARRCSASEEITKLDILSAGRD